MKTNTPSSAPVSERKKTVVMPAMGVCSGCHLAKLAEASSLEVYMNGKTSKARLARIAELADKPGQQVKLPNAIKGRNNAIKARSVSLWARLIETIEDKTIEDKVVRAQVARIVWWDYVAPQQKLLDKYLIFHENEHLMDIDKVRATLVSIGYSKSAAVKRVQKQEAPVKVEAANRKQRED